VTKPRAYRPLESGQRVYLRRPDSGDAEEIIAIVRASRSLHRPWVYPPETRPAFTEYLHRNSDQSYLGLLICRRQDDRIVGMANLSQIFRAGFQNAYLGFWVTAEFTGQGYMTEGLRLVLRYTFETVKLHRLEANVQPANEPSKALIKRCGFRYEGFSPRYLKIGGRWRDHERWAILREDWLSLQKQQKG
jgi:[ribosomal protein S5]-alanine N-acetyltransferase